MRLSTACAQAAWFAVNLPGAWRFERALHDVRQTQESLLFRLLHTNAATDFGRQHGFATLRTAEAFQDRVPLSTYEDYEPAIRRIADGDRNVLTAQDVRLFELSSGSTRAAKWIPYTRGLQADFRRAIAPWIVDLLRRDPSLLAGRSYWSISPALHLPDPTTSRIPIGFEDDSSYLGGVFKRLVDATLAVPATVARLRDLDLFRTVTLLHLLRAEDLRLVSVWHPSFLSLLLDFLETHWNGILTALHNGLTLDEHGVHLAPQPRRARALQRLARVDPAAIWPYLSWISCWTDGPAALAAEALAARLPHCRIQGKGLLATEGVVSLPFAGRVPLAITSHVFEFVDANGEAHFAWDLEEGESYSVVLTTSGGLVRYRLQDIVEVTGFLHDTPCIRFLHKEGSVSDVCGEKLHEGFVASVLQEVLGSRGVHSTFAMLAPQETSPRPGYVLYLESDADFDMLQLAGALETSLRRNPHYAYCVDLGQLQPATVARARRGAFERVAKRLQRTGLRLGDIKPLALSTLSDWDETLLDDAPRKTQPIP